jgi:hypothetical protein
MNNCNINKRKNNMRDVYKYYPKQTNNIGVLTKLDMQTKQWKRVLLCNADTAEQAVAMYEDMRNLKDLVQHV